MGLGSLLSRAVRRAGYRIAGQFDPPRDEAFRALLRSVRDLLEGREPAVRVGSPDPTTSSSAELAAPEPLPEDSSWPVAPVPDSIKVVKSIYQTGRRPLRYDLELFEELNAEYRDKPLVPSPPSFRRDARQRAAMTRIRSSHKAVGLINKTVLEIGCGDGFIVWLLGTHLGCDAHGVDVQQRDSWDLLSGEKVHFSCADISQATSYGADTFDRVLSFTVWEHVLHPTAMLQRTFDLLKPGGLAFIKANLFAGPKASHRYRDIYFPWPHLLFSDDVIRDWDVKHGRQPRGASWVNRLSWEQYERSMVDVGFILRHVKFDTTPIDEAFYERFEDILGRYRKADLSRDFFTVVLEKPDG